jgi:glucose-6-phosphate isomerase
MLEAKAAWQTRGLAFARHAVAITQAGSALDREAEAQGFIERFPMWDWVGGRTSVTSAVGLLPAALQGVDVEDFLAGARAMDERTRRPELRRNPAALLALAWHAAGNGRGDRAMVVLPYKDRLLLLSRYLQQLVMESIGKEQDLEGRVVHQGLTVYGNKGSTDQHAFVQQLRDGRNDFFVTFVRVLRERVGASPEVAPGTTSGDFLDGLLLGTRRALHESGRPSLTLSIRELDARALGMLIALHERAVGLYASLVGINAYHQPGVEAGKKAASAVLDLQRRVERALAERGSAGATCEELAAAAGAPDEAETVLHLLERLAANPGRGVERRPAAAPWQAVFVGLPGAAQP